VQVVVVPIYSSDDEKGGVLEVAARVRQGLTDNSVRVKVDDRDQHRPGFKFAEWELKGVPLRVEIGPKDVAAGQVTVADRISGTRRSAAVDAFIDEVPSVLRDLQSALFADAKAFRDANLREANSFAELRDGLREQGGFWTAPWCGDFECEQKVSAETKATIRVLPLEQQDPGGPCVVCGKPGLERATWAQSY
jgi:prolyl-tRNA synthetase